MAGVLTGYAAVVEAAPAVKARVSGYVAIVEAAPAPRCRVSGCVSVVESVPLSSCKFSGCISVVEYTPYIFVEALDLESTGHALSADSMISDRRFTGMRRKKRRG